MLYNSVNILFSAFPVYMYIYHKPMQCEDCIFTLKATRMPVTYYKVATLNEVSQKPEIRVRPVVEATLRYHREDVNSKQQHDFEELVRNAVQENWKDT